MPKTLLAIALALSWSVAEKPAPEFIPLEAARPVLQAFDSDSASHPKPTATPDQWLTWLRASDARVRQRLETGEEDSLTNLLRFGVTYTKEYRIDDEYLLQYGHSTLVNSFAENRANDLVRALASPNRNQGFAEMRAFVEKKGFSLATAAGRSKVKAFLLANLARMQRDLQQARAEAKTNRNQLFHDRGISLDSNLWPDYDIDLALQHVLAKGLLKRGSIRRVAIVGPGLDFVNKQEGVDYYPPQCTQPFAVLNSLLRLGIADPPDLEIYTLDISPRVNLHLQAALKNASAGRPYTMQLPWYAEGRWTEDFRTRFTEYWQKLGSQVGQPVTAIPVPAAAAGFTTRAVQVRAGMVQRIRPVDMNIVYQRLTLAPDQRFDLIIGTNILYYGAMEQSLVRANVATMLKPGGLLFSTDKLQDTVPAGLEEAFVTAIPMTTPPVITDYIYGYRLMTSEASKQRTK